MNANRERTALERKVFDAEIVNDDVPPRKSWWDSPGIAHLRAVLAYRFRKLPRDFARLIWFVLRGHARWVAKAWLWATYGDLRADARTARLAGDAEARRKAQELMRADSKARWGRLAIVVHRCAVTAAFLAPVALVLWCVDSWMAPPLTSA